MEKVASDDNSVSESSGILNKLPPWLVEMTENVKKLKPPEERTDFLSADHFSSDELQINSTIFSASLNGTEGENYRTDAVPCGLPFAVEAPDSIGGCIILQPSTTSSLPNSPKGGYEFHRAFSALSAFSLPHSNENEYMTLDKYLDGKDIPKIVESDSKLENWVSHSEEKSAESQHPWSHTMLQDKPIERLETNHSSVDIQTVKTNKRISRHQQQSTSRPSRINIPPYKGTSTRLQSMEEGTSPDLPIGIIKRKQDYLAGVASREDIQVKSADLVRNEDKNNIKNQLRVETTGSRHESFSIQKNISDIHIVDKVAQLNLQASKKPNLTEIIKKSVQTDSSQGENIPNPLLSRGKRPLYHYERYPTKDDNILQDFIIPELPRGSRLTIDILTTWGDKHYVGLNGIEIFSDMGESVTISKIWADPTDINELPEYNKDPRVVSNLVNGINQTTDDYNLWLAPYTSGNHHYIHMTFESVVNIAMIRIWNYNKSRIHSYRGVRDVKIMLDDIVVFDGEIARASGGVFGNINSFGDTILFTTDESILEMISKHDAMYSFATDNTESPRKETDRPITTDTGDKQKGRPLTCASSDQSNSSSYSGNTFSYVCKEIELILLSNWGHPTLIGLNGIELMGDRDSLIPLTQATLNCNRGNENLHRLIDKNNFSTEANHMWALYFLPSDPVILTITFQTEIYLTGIQIWNYNGSLDLSYCGVKQMLVKLDGKAVCDRHDGIMLRRAPGCCHYNFVQEINFDKQPVISEPCKQLPMVFNALSKAYICINTDYEAPMMPQGFVYQVIIFSTWGDPYYVGLTGIQMYDSNGYLIKLTEDNIAAYPESVNIIEGVDNDVRTPDKLIDGVNNTTDGHHMWLAPILPNQINRVYIIFDSPIMVSMIKLWNYKKTPQRGVKEFGILVDDLLVYNGVLDTNIPYGTVLFTSNKDSGSERSSLVQSAQIGQDIKLSNLERLATSGGDCYADPLLRPHTSLMQASLRSNTTANM